MKAKRKWYELLLPLVAALLVLAQGTVRTANAYEYVEGDPEYYSFESEDYNRGNSTYWEFAYADGDATEAGVCSCQAWSIAWAEGDSAYAFAEATGLWSIDWTWNGPPGEAPGGTLDWSHYGNGDSYASGHNEIDDPNTQSATSVSDADTYTSGSGTEGSASGSSYVYGYVVDYNKASGDISYSGNPSIDFKISFMKNDKDNGWYEIALEWDLYTGDEEDISEGTTYIYFDGAADCESAASANSNASGAESECEGDADADVSISASFEPNG